ncbi:MAG: hypothetical protein BAJATHORv1_60032 [Candidatus Thorarchaeota archaeon]|nr:MAG: hypothetical protein BAJATHORv1_60032 [Candidatus Thorarchaeota archaeon]
MNGIMLVTHAGEPVAAVGWEHIEGDLAMFGGFVSAIQMFIGRISEGSEIEELKFGDTKLLIGKSEKYHVITLHKASENNAVEQNKKVIQLLKDKDETINEGILDLIQEMVTDDMSMSEESKEGLRKWSESQVDKAKKAAGKWGKTVF